MYLDRSSIQRSKSLLLGHVYRPPDTPNYLPVEIHEKFETMLEEVCCEEKEAVLLGDFNYDYLKEQNNRPLKSITSRSGFSQMVNSLTRITKETASQIDLVSSVPSQTPVITLQHELKSLVAIYHPFSTGKMKVT